MSVQLDCTTLKETYRSIVLACENHLLLDKKNLGCRLYTLSAKLFSHSTDLYQSNDSYRYGCNTPTLIFEKLKSVEISKKHLNIISNIYKHFTIRFLKYK